MIKLTENLCLSYHESSRLTSSTFIVLHVYALKMNMRELLDNRLTLAVDAALAAGHEIKRIRDSGEVSISFKTGNNDLVTTADIAAERIILERIKAACPDAKFLAEESSTLSSTPPDFKGEWWIIDPVDGTTNYAYGQPQVGVSIAMAIDGVVQVGVINAPFLNEIFHAVKGRGAYKNNQPISVSGCNKLINALVSTGFPYERSNVDSITSSLGKVLKNCRDMRRAGAASLDLAWVACGRLDAFYETLAPWDIAAGGLIVREAGGVTGNFKPEQNTLSHGWPADLRGLNFCVGNSGVYEELLEHLRD